MGPHAGHTPPAREAGAHGRGVRDTPCACVRGWRRALLPAALPSSPHPRLPHVLRLPEDRGQPVTSGHDSLLCPASKEPAGPASSGPPGRPQTGGGRRRCTFPGGLAGTETTLFSEGRGTPRPHHVGCMSNAQWSACQANAYLLSPSAACGRKEVRSFLVPLRLIFFPDTNTHCLPRPIPQASTHTPLLTHRTRCLPPSSRTGKCVVGRGPSAGCPSTSSSPLHRAVPSLFCLPPAGRHPEPLPTPLRSPHFSPPPA